MKQGDEEWLALRRTKITGTDVPTIMDENPWKDAYQLWQEKKGLREVFETEAMREGRRLEPIIREMFEAKMGVFIRDVPEPVIKSGYDFMASLDGLAYDNSFGCELKSANDENHAIAKSGIVPKHYYGQVQWQMYCSDIKKWYYVSYGKSCRTLAIVEVPYDDAYIEKAKLKALEFLELMKLDEFPSAPKNEVSDEIYDLILKLKESEIILFMEKNRNERIRKMLLEKLNGQEIDCHGVKVKKCTRQGSPNYDMIPQLKDVNLDLYRKPSSTYWKIVCSDNPITADKNSIN